MLNEIGRLCVKIAGRDANKVCVIIDILEGNYVLIDGQTRRKKCNVMHLEPLDKILDVKKNASSEDVVKALEKENISVVKGKSREPAKRDRKEHKKKDKPVKEDKKVTKKPLAKKVEVKKEEAKVVAESESEE